MKRKKVLWKKTQASNFKRGDFLVKIISCGGEDIRLVGQVFETFNNYVKVKFVNLSNDFSSTSNWYGDSNVFLATEEDVKAWKDSFDSKKKAKEVRKATTEKFVQLFDIIHGSVTVCEKEIGKPVFIGIIFDKSKVYLPFIDVDQSIFEEDFTNIKECIGSILRERLGWVCRDCALTVRFRRLALTFYLENELPEDLRKLKYIYLPNLVVSKR